MANIGLILEAAGQAWASVEKKKQKKAEEDADLATKQAGELALQRVRNEPGLQHYGPGGPADQANTIKALLGLVAQGLDPQKIGEYLKSSNPASAGDPSLLPAGIAPKVTMPATVQGLRNTGALGVQGLRNQGSADVANINGGFGLQRQEIGDTSAMARLKLTNETNRWRDTLAHVDRRAANDTTLRLGRYRIGTTRQNKVDELGLMGKLGGMKDDTSRANSILDYYQSRQNSLQGAVKKFGMAVPITPPENLIPRPGGPLGVVPRGAPGLPGLPGLPAGVAPPGSGVPGVDLVPIPGAGVTTDPKTAVDPDWKRPPSASDYAPPPGLSPGEMGEWNSLLVAHYGFMQEYTHPRKPYYAEPAKANAAAVWKRLEFLNKKYRARLAGELKPKAGTGLKPTTITVGPKGIAPATKPKGPKPAGMKALPRATHPPAIGPGGRLRRFGSDDRTF